MSAVILLVEDNEDDVFAFKRALKKAQIQNVLHVAVDGKQALDYLRGDGNYSALSERPAPFIIFLDLKLPYVGGFEILEWIRKQPSMDKVVVIILTSSAEIKDQQRAYALGARTYLVKPPTGKCIRDIMASLESFWLSQGASSPVLIGTAS